MSEYITTRNALQCRSHHQKLEEKYLYPNKIISHFKQHNDLSLYDELKAELEAQDPITEERPPSNLKLPKHIATEVTPSHPVLIPEVRAAWDASPTVSPKADENSSVDGGFSQYPLGGWTQQGNFNMYPYVVYPMYHYFSAS